MTSLHADEAFLTHYQFSHDPFAARVPGFKFFPAQRKPVLGQLHHLARYSQLMLAVTGPEGSGKTLLRQALVASTNKQAVQSVVIAQATGSHAVLAQVAQGLGASSADLTSLHSHIGQLALTGQEVYLLVDDAQLLDSAALQTLLRLAQGNADGRAHVFLFGEDSLAQSLEALDGADEQYHVIELQPYNEDETQEYLAQRLQGAGQDLEVFTDEQLELIQERSGGWPGLINLEAREVLVEQMLAQRSGGRSSGAGHAFSLPKKHILALVVVLLGVAAAWLMQGRGASTPTQTPVAVEPQASLPANQTYAEQPSEDESVVSAPAIEFAGASQPLPLPLVGESQTVIRQPLAQAAVEPQDNFEPPAVTAPAPVQPVPEPVRTPVAAPQSTPAPAAVSTPKPAPKPAPAPVSKPVSTPAVAGGVSTSWYAQQPAANYTLQIMGSRSESNVQALAREGGGQYRYFKKIHQGQPLYVLTYGSFTSRAAAQAAVKSLPAKLQAGKPWPRTIASVQQEMSR